MFENQPDALDLFSLHNHLPRGSFNPTPQPGAVNGISTEQRSGPVFSLVVQGWYPVVCLAPSSKDPEHHHLVVSQGLHITILSIPSGGMSSAELHGLLDSSITSARKLSSMHFRSPLYFPWFYRLFCLGFFNTVSQCEL